LRDFCAFNKLKITNSFYRHKDIHKFTWEARGTKSIIDYKIIYDRLKINIEDTRVFRGSEIDSDHKLVENKLKIDPITKTEWKEYYGKLWNEQGSKGEEGIEEERRSEGTDDNEDMITIEELNEVLKHAKNRKSCGLDNLPMELWKFGGNELKIHLLQLFNKIMDKNQMPQEWETGMVINIHKKGTKSKCENHRGITLLPTAYKLFANIIKNRLNE